MWESPKCGRSFKRNGQSHYCGTLPEASKSIYLSKIKKYNLS